MSSHLFRKLKRDKNIDASPHERILGMRPFGEKTA